MGNKFQVKVDESIEELKHRLCHAVTSSTKERVQMLYWIKQGAIATRKELSQKIGRDESTIYRWLKKYSQGGISNLLEVKTPPGKSGKITPEIIELLTQRLSSQQGFKSYGQIQQWLNQECQVVLAYKTVHKLVRYKLQAKLKVPRPDSGKTQPEIKQAFKKTSVT
jgi:transposase